ncbi:hypothetical protein DL98DRAFT_416980 [Cadophora sp. DSE1049]|nr:hypothetical protein DL98DRAFT_416980 [Cadophora sp. DSE1049]
MVTRGFWNIRSKGKWYQLRQDRERIRSPDDPSTYETLKLLRYNHCRDRIAKDTPWGTVPIPFPFPLWQTLNYVFTLDLDSGHLTVSFWHRKEGDDHPGVDLYMRRLDLSSIDSPSCLSLESLLQNGSDPLLESSQSTKKAPLLVYTGYPHLSLSIVQPTPLNELQNRMFTDFVYQWRFFIDDRTIWPDASSPLFRRLAIALLRIAAWDFQISSKSSIVKLPLSSETFPSWESPKKDVYWFHGYLVILREDVRVAERIADAVARAKRFVGARNLEKRGEGVDCILISVVDIAFIHLTTSQTWCSEVFPLVTNSSATECSAGFRILIHLLTSHNGLKGRGNRNSLSEQETSTMALPTELLGMILNALEPNNVVPFAQVSFVFEKLYYSTLPQLSDLAIQNLDTSIPCCRRRKRVDADGLCCSVCYTWQHLECVDQSEYPQDGPQKANRSSLATGALGLINRRLARREGCHVMMDKHEKIFQLRTSAPAALRPELRMMDRDLTSTPPNQVDYALCFGGLWSGLAYGLDE